MVWGRNAFGRSPNATNDRIRSDPVFAARKSSGKSEGRLRPFPPEAVLGLTFTSGSKGRETPIFSWQNCQPRFNGAPALRIALWSATIHRRFSCRAAWGVGPLFPGKAAINRRTPKRLPLCNPFGIQLLPPFRSPCVGDKGENARSEQSKSRRSGAFLGTRMYAPPAESAI